MPDITKQINSSIYGPVDSWRIGKSLGIDLIMETSTCSFNCTYCQLGFIQRITSERKQFISTEKIIEDFKNSKWECCDVITLSGSGEPTLALNIGEVISQINKITKGKIPVAILTNATLFNDEEVINDVLEANVIAAKLDSVDDATLQMINRPASGISHASILSGIKKLKERFKGKLQLQIMFMPQNKTKLYDLAKLINEIQPDEVALNTPTRPYPSGWDIITRGAHGDDVKKIQHETKSLKKLTEDEADQIEAYLKAKTETMIVSIYKK